MEKNDFNLRTLLIDIGNKLSNENRAMLGFLLSDDVPRRDIDLIVKDNRASMNKIWEELINRQKITADNVDYLIDRFEKIQRIDLARQLRQYSGGTTRTEKRIEQPVKASNLFIRTDPEN